MALKKGKMMVIKANTVYIIQSELWGRKNV